MKQLLAVAAILALLAGCYKPIYTESDSAAETCRDLGHEGAALQQCIARRTRDAECRNFMNSRDYTEAEARRRGCS